MSDVDEVVSNVPLGSHSRRITPAVPLDRASFHNQQMRLDFPVMIT